MELIETKTVGVGGASSIEFTSITGAYTDLKLVITARSQRSNYADDFKVTINNNTSATYTNRRMYGTGTSYGSDGGSSTGTGNSYSGVLNSNTSTANTFGNCEFYFFNYSASGVTKCWYSEAASENNSADAQMGFTGNLISDTNPITVIKLESYNSPTLDAGTTASLYGISAVTSTPKATGGIISQDATYWYHTFPFTSTFTPTTALSNVDYLVIAGGGGGSASGAGAGGLRTTVGATTGGGGTTESKISLNSGTAYTISVGAGGAGSSNGQTTAGSNGANSSISGTGLTTITAVGGGAGTPGGSNAVNGISGGSGSGGFVGGGGVGQTGLGGAGTTNQGYAGGNSSVGESSQSSTGSGGGAGGPGQVGTKLIGATGGSGMPISAFANATFTGVSGYYAGGGGSAIYDTGSIPGYGGIGGGGNAASNTIAGSSGVINTGGGAGGYYSSNYYTAAYQGGSGLVILRYAK